MRELNSEAVLLDVVDLQDRDRIVTFLTPETGKKRGVAQGARSKFSRFAGRLQPMSRVEVRWFEKPERELVRIRDVTLVAAASWWDRDLESLLLGSYLAEQVAVFAQDNEPSERLYRLLLASSAALGEGLDLNAIGRYFEVWTLRLAGLLATPESCPQCDRPFGAAGAVLPEGGDALLCRRCVPAGGRRVAAATLRTLSSMMRQSPAAFAAAGAAHGDLRRIELLCRSLRRRFLGHELRSYEVMERTLEQVGSRP